MAAVQLRTAAIAPPVVGWVMATVISYRRTGGAFALLGLAAALTASVFAAAVVVALLIVAVGVGAVALLVRLVLPATWRRRANPPAPSWPQETIEATLVNPPGSHERDLPTKEHPA